MCEQSYFSTLVFLCSCFSPNRKCFTKTHETRSVSKQDGVKSAFRIFLFHLCYFFATLLSIRCHSYTPIKLGIKFQSYVFVFACFFSLVTSKISNAKLLLATLQVATTKVLRKQIFLAPMSITRGIPHCQFFLFAGSDSS